MQPETITQDSQSEYYFKEGCFILELANSPDDPKCSIARVRVVPGETTRWHMLEGVTERYVILQGKGCVEVGTSSPRNVRPGEVVHIPSGCRQRIANIGNDDLIFLAVCSPRFTPEVYQEIE